MQNFNLNPGGLIGALLGLGAFGAILLMMNVQPQRAGAFAVGGLIVGAVAGNFLWGLVFPPKK